VFVLNNKQLAFIKYEQQAAGELEYAVDFSDMDHAKFAEAAGGQTLLKVNHIVQLLQSPASPFGMHRHQQLRWLVYLD
jgi:thiamine pyrophosphate-dependent acetolactate synthase large subunit-like protein